MPGITLALRYVVAVKDGTRKMEDGRRKMEDGRRKMED
jgi:hypothetical protein